MPPGQQDPANITGAPASQPAYVPPQAPIEAKKIAGGMKVIQPLESSPTTQSTQPVALHATALDNNSQPIQTPNNTAYPGVNYPSPNQPIQAPYPGIPPVPQTMYPQSPVGMSRSDFEDIATKENKDKLFKKLAIFVPIGVIALVVIIAGGIFLNNDVFSSKLSTLTLVNQNYTYSFKYYKSATLIQPTSGQYGYKYLNNSTATVIPYSNTLPSSCSALGSSWSEAFSVSLSSTQEFVCTGTASGGIQIFGMWFNALNHGHFMLLTFNTNYKQSSSDYSTLETIFSSVKVSQ